MYMNIGKLAGSVLLILVAAMAHSQNSENIDIEAFHNISSNVLFDYVKELSSEKYDGRLSGSPGYEAAARWVAGQLKEAGLKPGVGDTSFFQWFPNAFTEVLNPGSVTILPGKELSKTNVIKLHFPKDFYPGSNSASGHVKGDVVYAGFGISAPELYYDDYAGLDVKGKIILIESGVPYPKNDSTLKKWEPYSYHRYKFLRARELGAVGLLYVDLIANPNTSWLENFVYAHISREVAQELLRGTDKKFADLKDQIIKTMQPHSFPTKMKAEIHAFTRNHPDAKACNVVGIIEGSEPVLKKEAIIIGAHLDHVGHPGALFPGALDNGSGCADILGAAVAMAKSKVKPKRSIVFVFFGGEECGLYGSKKSTEDPVWEKDKVLFMINLDMVGNGTGFALQGGASYPEYLKFFEDANKSWIHRSIQSSENRPSFSRPRTDSAVFQKEGYKTINIWTTGSVKPVYYHQPQDNTDALTPEIMEDAAKLLYLGILGIANK
jgi:hypothetical protein